MRYVKGWLVDMIRIKNESTKKTPKEATKKKVKNDKGQEKKEENTLSTKKVKFKKKR